MLHRIFLIVSLMVLFALTQIGAFSHEISHFNTPSQQSQQDQHTVPDQCGQCIAHAHAADGVLAQAVPLSIHHADFQLSSLYAAQTSLAFNVVYSARAPPSILI
ncbi:MAG: hypothetical protein B7X95_06650 [Methylophilaceae bacterium 17-44-8]|jgi:hypothetical protein|nr:MAG: hypothetical protein B7Y48_06660 [Methylophilales bacterium 28-44-11]OYZ10143.1 MAG: hypothetical protein B7Y32_01265 [Methylophilales bacterium 16-45-7]OZA05402.1 MAG: hypothetical protein B7X95_06650 [Methylophilaceae bacterium 17-44-8]